MKLEIKKIGVRYDSKEVWLKINSLCSPLRENLDTKLGFNKKKLKWHTELPQSAMGSVSIQH